MKYLLDTCTLLWFFGDESNLSEKATNVLHNPKASIFISAASLWEIAIKINNQRLKIDFDELLKEIDRMRFKILSVDAKFLKAIMRIDKKSDFKIHKDPFDRLLVATAQVEGLTIVTPDKHIQGYEVYTIW